MASVSSPPPPPLSFLLNLSTDSATASNQIEMPANNADFATKVFSPRARLNPQKTDKRDPSFDWLQPSTALSQSRPHQLLSPTNSSISLDSLDYLTPVPPVTHLPFLHGEGSENLTNPLSNVWTSPSPKNKPPLNPSLGVDVTPTRPTRSKDDERGPEWFTSFADWIDCLEVDGEKRAQQSATFPSTNFKSPPYSFAGEAAEPMNHFPLSSNYGVQALSTLSQTSSFLPSNEEFDFLSDSVGFLSLSRKHSLDVDSVLSPPIMHSTNAPVVRQSNSNSSLTNVMSPVGGGRYSEFSLQSPVSASLSWTDARNGSGIYEQNSVVGLGPSSGAPTSEYDPILFGATGPSTMSHHGKYLKSTTQLVPPKTSPPLSSNGSPGFSAAAPPFTPIASAVPTLNQPPLAHHYSSIAARPSAPAPLSGIRSNANLNGGPPSFTNPPPHIPNVWASNTPTPAPIAHSSILSPVSPPIHMAPSTSVTGSRHNPRPPFTGAARPTTSPTTTSGIIPAVVMKGIKSKDPLKPGDWICPNQTCRFHNFARRTSCVACGTSDRSAGRF
ncbi:hypothetical protein HDU79_011198 [Rhizoclosmatium sp. JEL0117]|nr:hypothetical protein HDU79_011198 [Rhizoclosmatium sp. JEL0117]